MHGGFWAPYLTFLAFCLGFAALSGALVSFGAPLAAGSGIPEIKTYLNGVRIRGKNTTSYPASSFIIKGLMNKNGWCRPAEPEDAGLQAGGADLFHGGRAHRGQGGALHPHG